MPKKLNKKKKNGNLKMLKETGWLAAFAPFKVHQLTKHFWLERANDRNLLGPTESFEESVRPHVPPFEQNRKRKRKWQNIDQEFVHAEDLEQIKLVDFIESV